MQIDMSNVFVDACIISSFLQIEWEPDYADTVFIPETRTFEVLTFRHALDRKSLLSIKHYACLIPDVAYLMQLVQQKVDPLNVSVTDIERVHNEYTIRAQIVQWWKTEKLKYANWMIIDTIQKLILLYLTREVYRVPPPFLLLSNN